jgi:hypothetical protein
MNHIGKYNNALFGLMDNKIVSGDSLKKITLNYHNGFNKIISNPKQV